MIGFKNDQNCGSIIHVGKNNLHFKMKKAIIFKTEKGYKVLLTNYQEIEKNGSIAKRFVMDMKSQKWVKVLFDFHSNAKVYQVITYTDYDERLKQYLKSFSN